MTNDLPDGMVFTPSTRTLSGTPTAAAVGVYDMTYTATNIVNETATQSFQLTVTANQPPVFSQEARDSVAASYSQLADIAIRSCDPPTSTPCDPDPLGVLVLPTATDVDETGNLEYSLTATSDSNTTANIDVADNLPVGLNFDADSRTLSGTPTAADTYSLIWAVDDTDSNTDASDTATIEFQIAVVYSAAMRVTDIGSQILRRGETKTIELYTTYFTPANGLNFDVISSNEKVLTASETGGVLTLTAATSAGGTSYVTVTASNAFASVAPSTAFEVTVSNTLPEVVGTDTEIETLSKGLTVNDAVTLALGPYFSDADGDTLRYKLVDSSDSRTLTKTPSPTKRTPPTC